ncbi:Uncharacterised protein [Zhongshania aliphaticivorans]|uniref:Uncharacterized protein n=1 Tax=Zhongshania aliphaticivorans TaxID=1470434 RepID=A0A5S9Q362_9GAMM|nr:DUF6491 family protein [Zhongshania aliphaticivorans]CAA0093575.1 Uncharacterised protein [Zhongshania aliphaticivorans]CAA0111556.1 Uncharacterised protein [Zhongshania aliphaticivorans]
MKLLLSAILSSMVLSPLAHAEKPEPNENLAHVSDEPQRCVSLQRIDRMDVVDNRSILFYMRGKQIFLNDLPYPCHGLSRHKTVMYRTSLNDLCNVDIITVLNSVGSGFLPGQSCGLGQFYPISKENADIIKSKARE